MCSWGRMKSELGRIQTSLSGDQMGHRHSSKQMGCPYDTPKMDKNKGEFLAQPSLCRLQNRLCKTLLGFH